jgi:hypothetical protein
MFLQRRLIKNAVLLNVLLLSTCTWNIQPTGCNSATNFEDLQHCADGLILKIKINEYKYYKKRPFVYRDNFARQILSL